MLINLIHGFASLIDNIVDKPSPLAEKLTGVPQQLRQLYNKEKIASLASAAIAEADTDKDGQISCVSELCFVGG